MGLTGRGNAVAFVIALATLSACSPAPDRGTSALANLDLARCANPVPAASASGRRDLRFTEIAGKLSLTGPQWESSSYDRGAHAASRVERNRRAREEAAIMAAGAAVADVDGDGWEDVFLTRVGAPNQLYRNECGNSFRDVGVALGLGASEGSAGAAWGDIDADGDPDLVVTSLFRQANRLYINRGDGSFTDEATQRGTGSRRDFTPSTNMSYGAALGDVDGDGDLDLVVNQWQPANEKLQRGRTRVLLNDGRGTFTDGTEQLGLAFKDVAAFVTTIEDINDDGIIDLLVTGDWGSSRLLLGTGSGRFRNATREAGVGTDENGMGSSVEDIDGDGDLDWFVTSIHGQQCRDVEFGCSGNRLYRNDGGGRFTDATDEFGLRDGGWGWGSAVADFDNDGDRDVVMTNGFESQGGYSPGAQADDYQPYLNDPMRFWENTGEGRFRSRATDIGLTDQGLGKAAIPFDFDRDGDLDLLVARTGQDPLLYRNEVSNGNAWLRVLPVDGAGQPAIGARVTVEVAQGGPVLRDHVRSGDTYGGSGSAWVHAGLGAHHRPVHAVRVRWPGSGAETVVNGVQPDQEVVISPAGRVVKGG